MRRQRLILGLLLAVAFCPANASATPPGPSVRTLIETDQTILGQEFFYPEGRAKLTAVVVTVPPGAELALHLHPVPVFAYVLKGELVVDYGAEGERVYRRGDALVEAFDYPHQGHNGGKGNVKILVVYAGADGVPNTVALDPE
jgi:quercetin dioxygenase-like cupin family protein